VLAVGANLALDRTLRMPVLIPGHVQRPRSADATAGGKAVNVCRAALAHGVRPRLVANLPGRLGEYVGDLLDLEGHDVRRVVTAGEARSAIIVIEDDARVTVLNEPGPALTPEHRAALVRAVDEEAAGHRVAVMSGSLPPGATAALYADLVDAAHRRGATVVLDAARQPLRDALAAGPDVVTPNLAEALAVLHGSGDESVEPEGEGVVDDAVEAAIALRAAGAKAALVTAGRHGVGGADARARSGSPHRASRRSTRSAPATRSPPAWAPASSAARTCAPRPCAPSSPAPRRWRRRSPARSTPRCSPSCCRP